MEGHIRKRGDKWYYSFEAASVDGKRKRIERVGGKTKKEAEKALREALTEYNNSGLHFSIAEISFSDYLDYWMENYVNLECKENTQRNYSNICRIHLKPYLGMYKLKSLTPLILQQHLNKLHANGLSRNMLRSIYGVMSGSLKYAVEPARMIRENPMVYVKMPKIPYKKIDTDHKIITQNEFNTIIERFPFGSTYYILLMICFYTGVRISEGTGLTWDKIDLQNGIITIDEILVKHRDHNWYMGEPKTYNSIRSIPIGDTLIRILKEHKKQQMENRMKYGPNYICNYRNENDRIYSAPSNLIAKDKVVNFVCTKENGEFVSPDSTRYCSKVINYELGIQFNFHSLRHTHATILIESGANMKDVQKRLGHSRLSTTMDTYVKATEKMARDTVEIFEKAVK